MADETGAQVDQPATEQVSDSGWRVDLWQIHFSIYTKHFDPEPDHVNNQKLWGVEAVMKNQWALGFALFDNSFGQNSEYLYIGKRWQLWGSKLWYFKLTGGVLHGYKEPYEDKIPLNDLGFAPVIVPMLGFRYKYFVTEFNLAGNAAAMITAGVIF
jgi:hypothetical protein